jgi:hypothetical protein
MKRSQELFSKRLQLKGIRKAIIKKKLTTDPISNGNENPILPGIKPIDIIQQSSYSFDPFMTTNINLRSAFQLQKFCCICGSSNLPDNPTQSHHLKHVRKGNISGFSQILKSLNRKTIPVCRLCHNKIHIL